MDALRERVASLEEIVGPKDPEESLPLTERVDTVVMGMTSLEERLGELSSTLMARIKVLEDDNALLKRLVGKESKLRVPEPKPFHGARDAKEIENFLWDMESYFSAARVPDDEKVSLTSMYLVGDAKLWWRTRLNEDASANRPKIDTWEALKKELKDQFLPCNTGWVARESLKKLKHTGTVRDYVKQFSSLMLDIQNMSEEDKMFNFLSGLQNWAQLELRRQGVKDLPSAIAAADGLVDFKFAKSSPDAESSSKAKEKGKKKVKDPKLRENEEGDGKGESSTSEGQSKGSFAGCFICNGSHRARDCPRRETISALRASVGNSESRSSHDHTQVRVNPLQLLNAIHDGSKNSVPLPGLLYVTANLDANELLGLVDSGATHSFLSEGVARKLNFKVEPCDSQMKAVNSAAKNVCGKVTDVSVCVGSWRGKLDFMVVPLDDFDLVLGNSFFIKARVALIPHLGGMLILDEGSPGFVAAVTVPEKDSKHAGGMISAIQVEHGVKRGEMTYLAALLELKPDKVVKVPDCVADDDIRVYGESLVDHIVHLRKVLSRVQGHKLYIKEEKGEFPSKEVMFLGYIVSKGQVRMDDKKVKAVVEWPRPTKIPELRYCLGLTNYYRKFIASYFLLTDLRKKKKKCAWTESCKPGVRLSCFDLPCEEYKDDSEKAMGGVLVQEGHPVAVKNRKLNEADQGYSAHEMLAVVHCLRVWQVYLLGTVFVMRTDRANTYFKTQKKLFPKQIRWQEFLAEYEFTWEHGPGKHNEAVDALSRKSVQEQGAALVAIETNWLDRIREQGERDTTYQRMVELERDGITSKFWLEDELLGAKGNRIYVPTGGDLRKQPLRETHDARWVGHLGMERRMALLFRLNYWPEMEDDIRFCEKTCLVCQQDKFERRTDAGVLQPVPSRPRVLVSMDFISNLPKEGKSSFELAMGWQPVTPHERAWSNRSGRGVVAFKFAREKQTMLEKWQGAPDCENGAAWWQFVEKIAERHARDPTRTLDSSGRGGLSDPH